MKNFKRAGAFVLMLAASFAGGAVSNFWIAPKVAAAQAGEVMNANRLYFTAPDGRSGGQVYFADGSGAIISLNDAEGAQKIQIGTYNGAGEQGLPFVALSDNNGGVRLLFRLAGPNQSPVLIFKDRQSNDRIVMGLGLNDSGDEPFLASFDKNGKKQMLVGSYP